MKLKNKLYDVLKWGLFIFEPALITLISGFGEHFNWDVTTIIFIIGAVTTFIGTITGISNIQYNKKVSDK